MGRTSVQWLSHAGFLIESPGGRRLLIDPWLRDNPLAPFGPERIEAADLILVTHDHFDHVGDAVEIANRTGAVVVAQPETVERLQREAGLPAERVINGGFGMNVGGRVEVGGIAVIMTHAFHSSLTASPAGYVLRLEDGTTLYHAGDTGLFYDMKLLGALYEVDIALLPIGGCFTMDPVQAVEAVRLIEPKVVIPMHYATFPVLEQTPDRFLERARREVSSVRVVVLKPGERFVWEA